MILSTGDFSVEVKEWERNAHTSGDVMPIGTPRIRMAAVLKQINPVNGFLIHNTAIIGSSTPISEGLIMCPYSVITTNCKLGKHLVMNLHSDIGHDCTIGDYVTLSPSARVSGNCKIGNLVYIGSNAVIKEGVSICDCVTIGAGAVVLNDITEGGTYVGVPAKQVTK
jgi:sugar O-acyltransferase (sialic acid O-acetyltransferase NeuD family)